MDIETIRDWLKNFVEDPENRKQMSVDVNYARCDIKRSNGEWARLTPKEWSIASYFKENQDRTISLAELLDTFGSSVQTMICFIRIKVPEIPIITRPGFGYVYEE